MSKYKVGQKVRVVEWVNMPQGIIDFYSKNECNIGEIGTLINIPKKVMDITFYDVAFENEKYPMGFFELELEPAIKVGEQLLLFEL